jgi:tetratricopeptide (TPR) repeat protein
MLRRLVLCAIGLFAVAMFAQTPDKFTNLQVFPKTIAKDELIQTMRGFSFATGLRCEGCHVQSADKKIDFAADDKPQKKTARDMLRMVAAINADYINKMGNSDPVQVTCMTCHHGLSKPRSLTDVMAETIQKENVAAAVAQYRKLREEYYGTGAYDFSETALNLLAERLMRENKVAEAVAIVELNADMNPTTTWALGVAAMAHRQHGDTEKAKADFKKLLEANPENNWAKEQLAQLNASK